MGVRIYELAKELGMPSKELIQFLHTQGLKVKSHMSSIEDPVANILRDRIKPKQPAAPADAAKNNKTGKTNKTDTTRESAPSAKPEPATGRTRRTETDARPAAAAASDVRKRGDKGDEKESEAGKGHKDGKGRKHVRIFIQDEMDDSSSFFSSSRKQPVRGRGRSRRRDSVATAVKRPEKVEVILPVTVKELSAQTTLKANQIIKTLWANGQAATINDTLDEEQVTLVCLEFSIDVSFTQKEEDVEEYLSGLESHDAESEDLEPRAPVVTFMGHVDHGKTSLLDKIRETKVASQEAGGITQHLGAYRVDSGDSHVVFIDTPGHQAFTEMRARGANVTDIAVLVVAADDGVMPQTEEAYHHAKAAGVPIVVALNKMDSANANPMRCKQQLSEMGLLPVEWNGDTEVVEVSAHTGAGIDNLLETLSLTAELLELTADRTRSALGVVLEAASTTQQGVVATVLVQNGTLRCSDFIVSGTAHGKVRRMWLNGTEPTEEATPSTPVQITGLNSVPSAGEKFYAIVDGQKARDIANTRAQRERERDHAGRQRKAISAENLFETLEGSNDQQELRLIVKSDVRGSCEALISAIEKLATEEVQVTILHSGVGAITQDDVGLADASDAMIIGFHVVADERAKVAAEERGVEIRIYRVIYEALDAVKAAMESRLAPEHEEHVRGHAAIRRVYKASKVGNIAGCIVLDGTIGRSDKVRLLRDGRIVYVGDLSSLKRFKDDTKEVREGFECGLKIAKYDDIKVGDVVEAFALIEKRRTI